MVVPIQDAPLLDDFVGCPSHMYISLRDVFYVPIATLKVCKLFQDVSTILNIEMIHLLKTHKIDLCFMFSCLTFSFYLSFFNGRPNRRIRSRIFAPRFCDLNVRLLDPFSGRSQFMKPRQCSD